MDRGNHGILAVASLPLKAVNRRLPRPSLINCEIRLSQIRQFASGFRALRAIPLNEFLGELGRKRPAVPLGISSLRFDRRGHIPEFHRRRLCLGGALPWWQRTLLRSEEHTSELQSLMRISYAVFCLKKKKTRTSINSSISQVQYTY